MNIEGRAAMLNELDRLERLMPEYSEQLYKVSKIIRNTVWPRSDGLDLAAFLFAANNIVSAAIDSMGQDVYLIKALVLMLCDTSEAFRDFEDEDDDEDYVTYMCNMFDGIAREIDGIAYEENWHAIMECFNPYFSEEFASDEDYADSIADLLETFCEEVAPESFDKLTLEIGNFKKLCCGIGGEWKIAGDVLAGSAEAGKENDAAYWWKPQGSKYARLSASIDEDTDFNDKLSYNEKTCCEELRLTDGATITFANFKASKTAKRKKVLNLDLDFDDEFGLLEGFDAMKMSLLYSAFAMLIDQETAPSSEIMKETMNIALDGIDEAALLSGWLYFLKEFCDNVIVPMDDATDFSAEHGDKCRGAYRVLVDFLEEKGISGIVYPSTRMALIGEPGTNLVLFKASDVVPVAGSLRVKTVGC